MDYDIIGDIHGQADKLEALLRKLGYQETAGAWRHPARQAIFVGDFLDRGPASVRSIDIARRMVDARAALAVMGNHEFNAIAWHTRDAKHPGDFLRPHFSAKGKKNRDQHAAFLAEVEQKPALHAEIVDWFLTLPLWLELPELLVVHACWHAPFMAWLAPQLREKQYLTSELMIAATDENKAEKDTPTPSIFKAVEYLIKGIEIPLPEGHYFRDQGGIERDRVRVRWWDEAATTYRSAAILSPVECAALPDLSVPAHARIALTDKPVFFGHYWLTGTPALQTARHVCVDYSAGRGEKLVAYRFEGQPDLSPQQFVWVD